MSTPTTPLTAEQITHAKRVREVMGMVVRRAPIDQLLLLQEVAWAITNNEDLGFILERQKLFAGRKDAIGERGIGRRPYNGNITDEQEKRMQAVPMKAPEAKAAAKEIDPSITRAQANRHG